MGRRRQYENAAERQRACRQRQEAATVRVDRRGFEGLHGRLEALQEALGAAARAGDPIARRCRAANVETMLEKLIGHFSAGAKPQQKQDD